MTKSQRKQRQKSRYLERLGEEVALLDVVLRRIDHVNIMEPGEAPWNATVFLERLNSLPAPFTVFRILCQPPHHEVRLERLKGKYFTWEFGGRPVFAPARVTRKKPKKKKKELNVSTFITGRENTFEGTPKCQNLYGVFAVYSLKQRAIYAFSFFKIILY